MKRGHWRWTLAAAALLALLFVRMMAQAVTYSVTFDEGPHLAVGYTTLRTGDLRLQPIHIHPPFANVLAALPVLLLPDLPNPAAVDGWEIASLSAVTDAVVWQYPHPARLIVAARLPIILLTLVLAALIYRWASDLSGRAGGLLALALCALDPNVAAHGALVTTDMAVTLLGFLFFYLLYRWGVRRSGRWNAGRLVAVGAVLGLALATKVSAVLLLPLGALLLAAGFLLRYGLRGWRPALLGVLILTVVAAGVVWAVYGFELRPLEGFPIPVPAATHVAIYRSLQAHYDLGHPAFLAGRNSDHGWWTYFPFAFAVKTPLATGILVVGAALLGGRRVACCVLRIRRGARWRLAAALPGLALLTFPLVHFGTALFSTVDIGYRHLLPALPFLFVGMAWGWRTGCTFQVAGYRLWIARVVCGLLVGWLFITAAVTFPDHLTYFNELAGGPAQGYRYLVDSNLDWGQNLWQLRDWMRDNGIEWVRYAHYSPARPDVYGVDVDWLPPSPRATSGPPFTPLAPAPGVYAVGATVLQGAYVGDVNTYAWFRSQVPTAVLGHALFVYEVPERAPLQWGVLCVDPGGPTSAETLRAGVGLPDLRVVYADCGQSWVFPAGVGPGAYLSTPTAEPPPGGVLEGTARERSGEIAYRFYRVAEEPRPVGEPPDVRFEGPLVFLGHSVDRAEVRPSETVELRTFWRVEQASGRPLSLMAHLTGPDGVPLAVGDGLGVSPEQWRTGDLIVQRHLFLVPPDTPTGVYPLRVGGYWLDTMQRWPVRAAEGGPEADQVVVGQVQVLP